MASRLLLFCRMMSQSPEAGLLASTDSTLARLHNQPAYQHRSSVHPLCWHTPSSVMSSPCQPAAVCVKSEVIQLPSNGVDENRSSADSWSYVSPSTVSAVSYYPRQTRTFFHSLIKCACFAKSAKRRKDGDLINVFTPFLPTHIAFQVLTMGSLPNPVSFKTLAIGDYPPQSNLKPS